MKKFVSTLLEILAVAANVTWRQDISTSVSTLLEILAGPAGEAELVGSSNDWVSTLLEILGAKINGNATSACAEDVSTLLEILVENACAGLRLVALAFQPFLRF